MAKPIAIVPNPAQNQQGVKDEQAWKLASAAVEHAPAMLALWELLQAAHEKQMIEGARGLVEASGTITENIAGGLAQQGSIRGMRNLLLLVEAMGSLDPETLHKLIKLLPNGLSQAQSELNAEKPPSLWASFKRLMSDDGRRAIAFLAGLAVALGGGLRGTKSK
jgi:uncharacterized protein YjgD (DUF1641 family)